MTVRDLGYRPYDGVRLPASHNTWVMLRLGLRRAWSSWLVRIAAFLGLGPSIVTIVLVLAARWIGRSHDVDLVRAPEALRDLLNTQTWLFVTMVTAGAGASAIAEDRAHRAFQFYFAKPVTPAQYLAGRVLAVAIWVFGLTFVPALLLDLALVGSAREGTAGEQAALLLPTALYCVVLATVTSAVSVATSSLGASRALTVSAWLTAFVVPHVLALVVDGIARAGGAEDGWPWLYLGSFTGLLAVVRDALFHIETGSALRWYHAAPMLAALLVGAISFAMHRLERATVIP